MRLFPRLPSATGRLVVVGGGTGGHVFPGLAVAEAWRRVVGGEVLFVGSERGMESRLVPAHGYELITVTARRLKNAGVGERLVTAVSLPAAVLSGRRLLKRLKPEVILGVGGFVSGPVVLAAALSGVPCAVAEQNARPGLTNRLLARFVDRVFTAFPEAAQGLPAAKVRMLGNPVRASIRAVSSSRQPGRRVLVLGGSQGAKALNEALPPVLAVLAAQYPGLEVVHQTGRDREQGVRAAYASAGYPQARVEPFIDDMASALAAADLVIARAGATTVAELACIGRASLLIPFPYAADDHQTINAQSLVSAGAAELLPETALPERLLPTLSRLLGSEASLAEMGRRAEACGHPQAAEDIVAELLRIAGRPGDQSR